MEKKYINRELQHQKINLQMVSMLSFGQLLTGLEVRSWGKILFLAWVYASSLRCGGPERRAVQNVEG